MPDISILAGQFGFTARLEETLAPQTCARFQSMLPLRQTMIHGHWSGEAGWIPLGELEPRLPYENATSYPAIGQLLFYSGGVGETEILLAYGAVRFSSKRGQLAGNHFLTIIGGLDRLADFGRTLLWDGAQEIAFENAE